MNWNKETILSFISFIRERPAIWDTQSPEHKIKKKRHDAVEEVAMLMGISIGEVDTKWRILRNQFSREKRKMTGIRTGSGADSVYTTKWYAYKEMEDLMSCNTPTVNITVTEEISSVNPTPSRTPTPAPLLTPVPSPNPLLPKKKKKREKDGQSSVYKEAVETLRVIRERKNSSQNPADDLTSFGSYIAAHLGTYSPHLQSKAKYAINKILYKLDMESLGPYSPPVTSVSSIDDSDSPFSPPFKSNRRFSTADDQCEKLKIENSITHTCDTLAMTDISQEAAENKVFF